MKHSKRPLVFTSRPFPIRDRAVANQLRVAFALPEFQQMLTDRSLMGGMFATKKEVIDYFSRTSDPRYIQRGSPCSGFAIVSCEVTKDDHLVVRYSAEGPQARLTLLAIASHAHRGGVPINVVTSTFTSRDPNMNDLSVVAVRGFYYAHKDDTWD